MSNFCSFIITIYIVKIVLAGYQKLSLEFSISLLAATDIEHVWTDNQCFFSYQLTQLHYIIHIDNSIIISRVLQPIAQKQINQLIFINSHFQLYVKDYVYWIQTCLYSFSLIHDLLLCRQCLLQIKLLLQSVPLDSGVIVFPQTIHV